MGHDHHVLSRIRLAEPFQDGADAGADIGHALAAGRALVGGVRPERVGGGAQPLHQRLVGDALPFAEALLGERRLDLQRLRGWPAAKMASAVARVRDSGVTTQRAGAGKRRRASGAASPPPAAWRRRARRPCRRKARARRRLDERVADEVEAGDLHAGGVAGARRPW
jgi:hypothetical protein